MEEHRKVRKKCLDLHSFLLSDIRGVRKECKHILKSKTTSAVKLVFLYTTKLS